ncbi:hypothetical protein DSL72_006859 [Monilinia vaccinii-corymbosi]|uniref:Cytochrome P450 n=1 Tax=Monilinia vaccinii-corymbosi TaxID=61207 RepID=A0A8A3PK11_9HELO|nr:hypothetical protein DSL72_006859 [Monilinia vaccinii-corymbosi]
MMENSRLSLLSALEDWKVYLLLALGMMALLVPSLLPRKASRDAGGPICVPATIPVIGHIIGIFWYKNEYYGIMSQKWGLPIFTLRMINQDIHVVTSPSLVPSLQRQHKAISLWQLEGQFGAKLAGLSKSASEKLLADVFSDSDTPSFILKGIKVIQGALSSSGGMVSMLREAARVTKNQLDNLAAVTNNNHGSITIDLWEWVQHEMTLVLSESLYGVKNPYRDPKVEAGFWAFSDGSMKLLLPSFLLKLIASKALRGRSAVVIGFQRYFSSGHYLEGSELVKSRYKLLVDETDGAHTDLAKNETISDIAALSNTSPTMFWLVYHLFSDPHLLKKIRSQVDGITTSDVSAEGKTSYKIHLKKLHELPLLKSMIMETLRFRSTGTGPRKVLADTLVGQDQYLLKKDSMVVIANRVIHFDKSVWGETADTFRADRFCNKTPPNAFRAFGGGVNTCPGKGFVTPVMAAFVGMLAMRFDIIPDGNEWIEPIQDTSNMSAQLSPPMEKLVVDIVPREGIKGVVEFEM